MRIETAGERKLAHEADTLYRSGDNGEVDIKLL